MGHECPRSAWTRRPRFAAALAVVLLLVGTLRARGDAPTGVYALGAGRDNPISPLDERLTGIRSYDYVSGFTLRALWSDLEPAQDQYNFAVIDAAVQSLAALGRGLSLEILMFEEPQYVLSGAASTYVDHRGGTNPVPWDAFAQERHDALFAALGSHVVQGVGGAHALSQDPTLKSIDAAPAGLNFGVRDINSGIRNHPDYTQQRYVDAVVGGVNASAAAFPDDTNFLAFFGFSDGQPGTPVDEQIIERLATAYNGPGQTKLAFFVENLSDDGPIPLPNGTGAGNNLADWVGAGGPTMMQALDSWLKHPAERNAVLDSRNPATGIALADDNFGTRFFELYIADLDGAATGALDAAGRPIVDDLRAWHATLTAVPELGTGADFDESGLVDDADLALWEGGFGTGAGATRLQGDADGDLDVDGADLLAWQRQLGNSSMPQGAPQLTAAVPEPGAVALISLAGGLLLRRGRISIRGVRQSAATAPSPG